MSNFRRTTLAVDAALSRILAGAAADACEGPQLDFKEDRDGSGDTERKIVDAAICFANAAGGTIVVGVADKVPGLAALTGTRLTPERIRQRTYELTRPPLLVDAEPHPAHPSVLLVHVPQSTNVHSDTAGRVTRRLNRDCLPMDPDQVARLADERRGVDWSSEPSGRSATEALPEAVGAARSLLRNSRDPRHRPLATGSTEDLLRVLGLLLDNGSLNRAGALLLCSPDAEGKEDVLYQFRETPSGEARLVERLSTPLVPAFLRLLDLVAARQASSLLNLPSGQQIAIEDFPALAVREALSNALCHRDYRLRGVIVIEHSSAVFSVTSPGPLVAGVTEANILTTPSRPRNAAIARAARILGLAEELGRGVDRMYREMSRSGRTTPEIQDGPDQVRVVLTGGAPNTRIVRFLAGLPAAEQEDTDTNLVIWHLCHSITVTAASASGLFQKSVAETEVVLRRLSADEPGLLERTRETARRSHPTYRLRAAALRELGPAVRYQRRTVDERDRKVMAHLREYGRITNATLRNLFDVDVWQARDMISDLARRDLIVIVSQQQRGPAVEWGPGPAFPTGKGRRRPAS